MNVQDGEMRKIGRMENKTEFSHLSNRLRERKMKKKGTNRGGLCDFGEEISLDKNLKRKNLGGKRKILGHITQGPSNPSRRKRKYRGENRSSLQVAYK